MISSEIGAVRLECVPASGESVNISVSINGQEWKPKDLTSVCMQGGAQYAEFKWYLGRKATKRMFSTKYQKSKNVVAACRMLRVERFKKNGQPFKVRVLKKKAKRKAEGIRNGKNQSN